MLEWFKVGFGLGAGLMAAVGLSLAFLGAWDWVVIYAMKIRFALRDRRP
ncbi:MAG: hypothetical protein PHX53_05495 [Syntrophales bacterium]|nr:hypothetical protein [Syntrophales bacterium]